MELKIDRGLKTYDVKDADGSLVGTISFNPSDIGIVSRFDEAGRNLQAIGDKLTESTIPSELAQLEQEVCAQFDYIFGTPVSDVFFAGVSSLALCDDGEMLAEKVLTAVQPLIEEAMRTSIKASNERAKKRAAAYQGTTKGLAPGQKA